MTLDVIINQMQVKKRFLNLNNILSDNILKDRAWQNRPSYTLQQCFSTAVPQIPGIMWVVVRMVSKNEEFCCKEYSIVHMGQ